MKIFQKLDFDISLKSVKMNNKTQNKVIILGDSGIGKTCLLLRKKNNQFYSDQTATIGIDHVPLTIDLSGQRVELTVFDTAGQEQYKTITRQFYQDAVVAILCFCPLPSNNEDDPLDFINIWNYRDEVINYSKNCQFIFCATKSDSYQTQDFPTTAYRALQERIMQENHLFYETSAALGTNVNALFEAAAELCIHPENSPTIENNSTIESTPITENTVDITKSSSKKKESCC